MFKITNEFKKVPTWFSDIDAKKFIHHPIPSIKYLIYAIQAWVILSSSILLSLVWLGGAALLGFKFYLILLPLAFMILVAQVVILGIHAKSPLAWLGIATIGLQTMLSFTPMIIVGLVLGYLLNRDETIEYFNPASANLPTDPTNEPTLKAPETQEYQFS